MSWTNENSALAAGVLYAQLPFVNVMDAPYNAKADGTTDDTAAIQAALSDINTQGGGIVQLPAATCVCASALNVSGYVGVWLRGVTQAKNTIAQSTVLKFTSSTSAGIIGEAAVSFRLSNLYIYNSNASWSGILLNFDRGAGATDTSGLVVEDNTIGVNADTSSALLSIDKNIEAVINHNVFLGGVVQIRGISTAGHYANAIQITRNAFQNYTTAAIKDPGAQAVTISENTFEPGAGGIQKAVQTTLYNNLSGAIFAKNWIGDSTTNTQTFVELSGTGIVIQGNFVAATSGNTVTGFRLRNVIGCDIRGNRIGSTPQIALDFDGGAGSATSGVVVEANAIDSAIPISSLTSAATTATAVTTVAHGLSSNYVVSISGANEAAYNGIYTITVSDATTFTYTFAGAVSPATGTIVARAAVVNFPSGANYKIADNCLTSGLKAVITYPQEYVGSGAPSFIAAIGSTYRRTNGGAGTSFYVNQDGTGSGWAGK